MSGGRGHFRPMPEGFPEVAWTMTGLALQRLYSAGSDTVFRWRQEVGEDPRRHPSALPDDFAAMARTLHREALKAHYGIGEKRLRKWVKQSGARPKVKVGDRSHLLRPPPEDIAELAPIMTKSALQEHYRTSYEVLNRWLADAKLSCMPMTRSYLPKAPRKVAWEFRPRIRLSSPRLNYSEHDQAADVLRRYYPVYRCDERGRADQKGKLWRVGNTVVDGDELLARAERKRA